MADDATSSSHEKQDQFDPPIPAKENARKKIRPTYSCLNCHKRKVKVVLLSCYNNVAPTVPEMVIHRRSLQTR